METFGEIVERARKAKGWNRQEADRATGIPAGTWKNIESRGTDPQLSTVQRLLDALDLSCAELVNAPIRRASDPDDDPEADPASRLGPDPGPESLGESSAGRRAKRGRRRGSGSTRRSS